MTEEWLGGHSARRGRVTLLLFRLEDVDSLIRSRRSIALRHMVQSCGLALLGVYRSRQRFLERVLGDMKGKD